MMDERDSAAAYPAFEIEGAERAARWLITCEHATNVVPPSVNGGCLGVPAADMGRHIAYDIGAAGVARRLAERLSAPAIFSTFSRLVIDPNRGEDDPTLLMQLYDGTVIPGNRRLDAAERERRLELFHRPYHRAVAELAGRRDDTVIVAMHSFTPRLLGRMERPWQIGILHAREDAFAKALIALLMREPDLIVGDNEPYSASLPGDLIDRHALAHGRPHALIELRHDLIVDSREQVAWADRLAPVIEKALEWSGV